MGDDGSDAPKRLGQWAHTFLILGMMLGGGTFGIVRELSRLVGPHLWLPFALAGSVVTLTSESMAYLISEHPGAGSHTRFVLASTGSQRLALIVGCLPLIDAISAFAVCALLCGNYLVEIVGIEQGSGATAMALPPNTLCAVGLVALMYAVQAVGVREAAFFCNLGTVIEIITLLAVVSLGAVVHLNGSSAHASDAFAQQLPPLVDTTTATVLCVFAYGGLPQGLDFASEMEDPRRSVARSVRKTTLAVSVIYVLFGLAAATLVPASTLAESAVPLIDMFSLHFDDSAALRQFWAVLGVVSIGNTSFGAFMAASRILWGMSDQGMFPDAFKSLQLSATVVALIGVGLVAMPDAVFILATCGSTFLLIAFGACNYSAFVLQRRSGASAARLLMPAVALLCTTSVLVCAFVQDTDVRKASTTSCVVLVVLVCCSFRISDQKKLQQPMTTESAKKLE